MSTVNNETFFPVYVVADSELPLSYGETLFFDDYEEGMKIEIRGSMINGIRGRYIFAHEFMHAITNEYTNSSTDIFDIPLWFAESLAVLAGLVCSGLSSSNVNKAIQEYKNNCHKSIFDNNTSLSFKYGTVLYILYILTELGDWLTIEEILYNYYYNNNPFSAINNASGISSYSSAFAAMAGYNYDTSQFYYNFYDCSWGNVRQTERHLAHSFQNSVNPMATQYEVYNCSGHDMTLTLEVSSATTNGLIYKKICESTNGVITISTIIPPSTRITATNFGDSDCENLILAVVNSVYTNNSISYTVTPSLS